MPLPLKQRILARLRRAPNPPQLVPGQPQRREGPWVELRVDAAQTTLEEAVSWCRGQTLREVSVAGFGESTETPDWSVDRDGPTQTSEAPGWWLVGERPPEVHASWLESAALVAAAESVDSVTLAAALDDEPPNLRDPSDLMREPWCHLTLWSRQAFQPPSPGGGVLPKKPSWSAKTLPLSPATEAQSPAPYLRPPKRIAIDDLSACDRHPTPEDRRPLLVLTPFLARGGAEHTLFETLRELKDRFAVTIVTLAPHREELGDRRTDFLEVTPRILCLGDLVHPAAMPGILCSLLTATGAKTIYNANSTTLFYDFAPLLKQFDPTVKIIDHLYDHQVGYIERYADPSRLDSIDACVAENHLVAKRLTEEFGWPSERVPVVWPCGRNVRDLPPVRDREQIRLALRAELSLTTEDIVFLTAARMHPQKRPLDLIELAQRVADLPRVHFVVAGGGPLAASFDETNERTPNARIRRLPFRKDIPNLILAADFGCLVSEYEGLPVFMMECFQLGRPFLGTDAGDLGRVLSQSGAGVIVDTPGDLDALEEAVRRLAQPELYEGLCAAALKASQQFSVEACAERYASVFVGDSGR